VTSSLLPSSDGFVPAWPCSQRGLPGRLHYCRRRWSLTPPFHSDPVPCRTRRPVSVALVRQVNASRRFPRPGCYPTLCSMECGLSSMARTAYHRDRPANLKTAVSYRHTVSESTTPAGCPPPARCYPAESSGREKHHYLPYSCKGSREYYTALRKTGRRCGDLRLFQPVNQNNCAIMSSSPSLPCLRIPNC
jgi:hypothetical protein